MIKKITLLGFLMFAMCWQVALSQVANFDIDQGSNICVNECITITDLSTSTVNITGWVWTVTPAVPIPNNMAQDPGTICFPTSGTYLIELQMTDANGAVANSNRQLNVVVCPGSISAGFTAKTTVCLGECITLRDTSVGGPVGWSWLIDTVGAAEFQPSGDPTSIEQNPLICFPIVTVNDPITIQLEVTDADGKVSKATKQIVVVDNPTVVASVDTIVELGNPAIIGAVANGASRFRWEPSETVVNPKVLTTFAYPVETTDYTITVEDANGCTATDTVRVYLNFLPNIGVPTAFTPNGDGRNDLLVVKGLGLTKCIFKVYNRYGIQIFESTVQKNGWDGNLKGKQVSPGTYYWTLDYEFNTGKNGTLSGNTTLVR